jgi:hypothetical protein
MAAPLTAFRRLITGDTFCLRRKPLEIYLCGDAAKPLGLRMKGFEYQNLFVWAQ